MANKTLKYNPLKYQIALILIYLILMSLEVQIKLKEN